MTYDCDVLVIGAGQGGLPTAHMARSRVQAFAACEVLGRVSEFRRAKHDHFVDLHVLHGIRYSAYTEARFLEASKRHPVDPEGRVIIHFSLYLD